LTGADDAAGVCGPAEHNPTPAWRGPMYPVGEPMPCAVPRRIATTMLAGALLAILPAAAVDEPSAPGGLVKRSTAFTQTTDRIIVRLRADAEARAADVPGRALDRAHPMGATRARALGITAGTALAPIRRTGSGAHVLALPRSMSLAEVDAIVTRLRDDPEVEHAEPDRRKVPLLVPNDPLYRPAGDAPGQWSLREGAGGINAEGAWNVTTGSAGIVVALLDTGLLTDPDLVGRLLPGYDFISADSTGVFSTANDGDGRDTDTSDPGNWLTAQEAGQGPFTECPAPQNSDWHGTHTAGIIAATGNNGGGIAGVDWNATLLPVRVLGKCGGYTSDIIDGLRWAAGLTVPGVADNPRPANVINMSLGGTGACSVEEQAAINQALARPNVKAIVTAAGNEGGSSLGTSPANCTGVIAVAATDIQGRRAPYSNGGVNVTISGPGGYFSCGATGACAVPAEYGILSLFNTGTTTPVASSFAYVMGTSEAAAHVTGVIGLMLARNPGLTPWQVWSIFRSNARPFPDTSCTTALCGSGIVDALRAVQAAASPPTDQGSINFGGPNQVPTSASPPSGGTTTLPSSGSSGGGGGGCSIGGSGAPDWLLSMLLLIATLRVTVRRGPRRRA